MSNKNQEEITNYFIQNGWNINQIKELGLQCQWDKTKMIETFNAFDYLDDDYEQHLPQNLLNNGRYNHYDNDEQKQLEQAIIASQQLQDNAPIIEKLRFDDYPVGLSNLGNTCYFNCVLQIVFYNPILVQQILEYQIKVINNQPEDNLQLKLSQNFMTEFQYIIAKQILWNQKYIKPQEFYEATYNFEKQKANQKVFPLKEFRDLSEYLSSFMQLIDQSLSQNFKKLNNQINHFNENLLEKQYIIKQDKQHLLQWNIGLQNKQIYYFLYKEIIENNNYIKELPNNLIFSIGRTDNQNQKTQEELYFPLELYLDFVLENKQAIEHVQKYINQQLQTQQLFEKLKKQADAFEKVIHYYESLPTFDIFILNNLKLEYKQKLQEMKQQFPLNYHLLNEQLQQTSKHLYVLTQIVAHTGSIHEGHYYLYQYNFYLKRWFKYNDQTVLIQTEQEIITDSIKQGSILIYINQEQKKKVESYQKQLHDIEILRKTRGKKLQNHIDIQPEILQKIPSKVCKDIIQLNETFLFQYEEQIKKK